MIPWAFRVFRVWMVLRYVWDVEVCVLYPEKDTSSPKSHRDA